MPGRAIRGEMINRRDGEECALYRLFSATGELLYVGITDEPMRRWAQHAERNWWPLVATYDVVWYPSRSDAAFAEVEAIAAEGPRHNVQLNRRQDGARPGGSPVLTQIVLREYRGRCFSTVDLAKETGFSLTSARKTLRALLAGGHATLVGSPESRNARRYTLVDVLPPAAE